MAPIIDTTSFANIARCFNPNTRNVFPMRGMLKFLRSLPSVCHICRRWPSQPLCTPCVERFAQPTQRCPTCALTLTQPKCRNCAQHPSPLDTCVAAVSYTFPWAGCIARFKLPRQVLFMDSLPKSALGKVQKPALLALLTGTNP